APSNMHRPCVMLLSAARNNLVCLRRRLLTNNPANAAAPQANGRATTSAAMGVDACVSIATIHDVPHSVNTATPSAPPATPAMITSGQLRLSLGRLGTVASIASGRATKRRHLGADRLF